MKRSLLLLIFVMLTYASVAFAQSRLISRPEIQHPLGNAVVDKDARFVETELRAFSIVSIKVEENPVSLDKQFDAGTDWLKTLTVRIKNTTDQPIKSLRIHFALPESKSDDRAMSGFSLEYGKELSTGISYGEQKMIAPGEEIDIVRNQKHYERDSLGILRRTGMSDFTKIILGFGQATLADGTQWITWKAEIAK